MLFTHFLDQGASINPGGVAFIDGERHYRFDDVQRFTCRFANKLRMLGLGLGANGSILSFNDAVAFQCAFGLHRAGVAEVHDIGLCTICSDRGLFFSHRRDRGVTPGSSSRS